MPDYGARVADGAIDAAARKIRRIYRQAAKDLKAKLDDFNARHRAKQKEMLDKLNAGEITKAAYDSWMKGQVFIGKQWRDKLDSVLKVMQNATKEAVEVVENGRLDVFAENYNYMAYKIEKRVRGAINFNVYNERSVAKLIRENPKMLPKWKVDEKKDYKWNRQKVENTVTQGIIQGEGIEAITKMLIEVLCTQNENRMRTFARTSMTGAQNAGKQAQMEDAEDMGIKLKKRWLATLDNRTRDTHQELDGQEVPVKDPFKVKVKGKMEEIMNPGDPNALPCLVYNCRCTMIEVYEGINRKSVRRAYEDPDGSGRRKSYIVENMTYKEWKAWKENGKS
ncbi:MAG: hypothetical protein J6S82_03605 [Bacteroidales bacterium]|nr:hypothetical protein [Bacteroidales bacterium]